MPRRHTLLLLCIAFVVAMLAVPMTASAILENEYGMKYAGEQICTSCHALSYGETTHGDFAIPEAQPSDAAMWPAGRIGVGEMVNKSQVAFTLGAGTGLREYLVNNDAAAVGDDALAIEIQGGNRYATAVEASKKFASATTVVVATGESFPDALGGAALAGATNGPLLLTPTASVPAIVIAEIDRLNATTVYVLGGTNAVSNAAASQIDAIPGVTVTRLAGSNRYATANLVANEAIEQIGPGFTGDAFMATGVDFPDALASSPIMAALGRPLVLVDDAGNYTLPAGVTRVKVLGGTNAVPASVVTALGGTYDGRLSGANRYATAVAVAEYGVSMGMTWNGVGIVDGDNFADALCAGPLLGSLNTVMLMTASDSLSAATQNALVAHNAAISEYHLFGGLSALSFTVRAQIDAVLTGTGAPVGGVNPFVVPSLEWDPILPTTWEMGLEGIEFEAYTCGNCHHLGWTTQNAKPATGTFSTAPSATVNAWVTDPASADPSPEKYIPGASVQCEVCHGTGQAGTTVANHFGVFTGQVKILRGTELLDSGVCGKCHASWESGNTLGYTPDQNILTYANPYDKDDIPTAETWNGGVNAATAKAWRFYPNGANRSNKHVYYTEWALSGHALRGAYTNDLTNPRVTPYMADGTGNYNSTGANGGTAYCTRCHTGEGYGVRKGLSLLENYDLATQPTGRMGQECASCHIAHNAPNSTHDNGMDVRKPDAGVTQSGIVMTSICEDCHNWQRDQQGDVGFEANPQPAASLGTRGGYNHPTREIYNGVGMYEVADAGKFMPGVKCEQCHMPATRSDFPDQTDLGRYEDRSWKRYTHSMHIMKPGDAAEWGLAPWGDSCSPCHPGQTQTELQVAIEEWQADAADAAADTTAAYNAAYTLAAAPGASETSVSAGFTTLMGRAYYNYRNYVGEGSSGVHNPRYTRRGLEAATKMALSVNGEFAFVTGGTALPGTLYVTGQVLNGDGSPAVDAKIVLTTDGGTYETMTDANGNFVIVYMDTESITALTWERCSDADADLVYVP